MQWHAHLLLRPPRPFFAYFALLCALGALCGFLSSTICQLLACSSHPRSLRIVSTQPHILHPLQQPTHPHHLYMWALGLVTAFQSGHFISPGHRSSLNGWIPSPWHLGHHMSTLPSYHYWPFVQSNWTVSGEIPGLFASQDARLGLLHCCCITL